MTYMVEVVNAETKEVTERMGPMIEMLADKVERSLLRKIDDEKYFVQVVRVSNDPEETS